MKNDILKHFLIKKKKSFLLLPTIYIIATYRETLYLKLDEKGRSAFFHDRFLSKADLKHYSNAS